MPTKVKQLQETSEWSKVFPQKIDSKNLSCIFMKKLFAVALSNILFLRRIFPERAFKDKQIEGLLIKILKNEGEFPPAERLINWARGCFDAMEKGYLKTVIVGIHTNPEDLDTAIESYSFRFSYSDPENGDNSVGVDIDTQSKVGLKTDFSKKYTNCDVKETTLSLVRTLILASRTMGELPSDVFITMKLLYHDEITPPEYEPPGFRPADYSSFRYLSETMSLLVGNVETAHHNMQLKLKTDKETFVTHMSDLRNREVSKVPQDSTAAKLASKSRNFQPSSTPTSVSLTGLDKDEGEADERQLRDVGGASAPLEISTPNSSAAATPGMSAKPGSRSQSNTSTGGATYESDDYEVRCPCRFSKDDGIMIVCDFCRKWQHALCFGILDEADAPESHICDICAEQQPELTQKGITDPSLLHLSDDDKVVICVYRRILMMCRQVSPDVSMTPSEISRQLGIDIGVCQGLTSRLKKEGILVSTGNSKTRRSKSKSGWKVEREKLQSAMIKAFQRKQECQELESQCVTIGMDMNDYDKEMQAAEELLTQTQNLQLSFGSPECNPRKSNKRRMHANSKMDHDEEASKLLPQTQKLQLSLESQECNPRKGNKRRAHTTPKLDQENASPVLSKKKKVSVVRTPQRIF